MSRRPLAAGVILTLTLAAGCEPVEVSALEEAHPHDKCLFSILYEVENDRFRFAAGGVQSIGSEGGGGGGIGGGDSSTPGIIQELDTYDGFVRLLCGGGVAPELTINKEFLQSGRVEVLACGTPQGTRFEYHVYTKPDCNHMPWAQPAVWTREEIEARER